MRRVRRVALGALVALVVITILLSIVAVSVIRRPFPQTTGKIDIPGLSAPVEVLRDERGIPTLYGDTDRDLALGQGYVHAQDRFFEMDLRRHIASGRLAELVGAEGVAADKVIRTMGWRRVAEQELPLLDSQTRTYLQAYADGVNTYLKGRSNSQIALEYTVLSARVDDHQVEQWSPVDSLTWLKAMAWDLRGNYTEELTRARLGGRMSGAQLGELFPPYDYARAPIVSADQWQPASTGSGVQSSVPTQFTADSSSAAEVAAAGRTAVAQRAYAGVSRALAAVPTLLGEGEGVGSNAWVIGPEHTQTGAPILANDPHLATSQPGVWYQNGLRCREQSPECALDVSGFSFAGLPGVVIGHNSKIAWGFTNLSPDVTDFYLERIDGDTVRRGGAYEPITVRRETITVAGEAPQEMTVRSTRHGPIMSDVLDPVRAAGGSAPTPPRNGQQSPAEDFAVSMAWTALQPGRTADAIFALNTAQNFSEFRAAAALFEVPSQNLLYADVDGNIGYQAPGRIPLRESAFAGLPPGYLPAPGWDPAYDWTGTVPFAELPWAYNPDEGYIVTANQAVSPSARPFLTQDWDYGYRSQRIRTLIEEQIESGDPITVADTQRMQRDDRNDFAPVLVAALLATPLDAEGVSNADAQFVREAQDLLRDWDYSTPADGSKAAAAAAYYNAVWSNLVESVFNDELPANLKATGGSREMAAVAALLEKPTSPWWDDRRTADVIEGRDQILRQAQFDARMELTRSLGKDPNDWSWGDLHTVTLRHKIFGGSGVPGVIKDRFNRGAFPMPGGSSIVNANAWDASVGYEVTAAPSMRMVVNLADLDRSSWINQTGASGHAFSSTYSDQSGPWARGEQDMWPFSANAVRDRAKDVLTLRPTESN